MYRVTKQVLKITKNIFLEKLSSNWKEEYEQTFTTFSILNFDRFFVKSFWDTSYNVDFRRENPNNFCDFSIVFV